MSETTIQAAPVPVRRALSEGAREIAARVGQLRWRERRVGFVTGVAMVIVAMLGWLVVETVTDFLTNLPWVVRLLFLMVGVGGTGATVWWFVMRPMGRRIDDETVALMVERKMPVFRGRFIASVQLAKTAEGAASPGLIKALVAETTAMSATMDFRYVIETKRWKRWRNSAVGVVLLVIVLIPVGGSRTMPLVRRAFLSREAVPRKTLILEIKAPRIVAVGDDWHLSTRAGGIVPPQGRLMVKSASGRRQTFDLLPESAPPVFGRTLHSVQESFSVVVGLGDAETDSFSIQVKPRPTVTAVECRQTFPAYTRLPARQRSLGDLKILAGSKLALKVKANAVVKKGEIRLVGMERDKIVKAVPLAFDGKGGMQLAGEIDIPTQGASGLTVHLVDEDGIESRAAAIYPLEILPDQAPTIKILWPDRREELVTREARMLLAFEAKDDIGVARVRLHYAVDWVEGAPHKTIELDVGDARPKELVRKFDWSIGKIRPQVEEGKVIDYWLEVLDANDVSGPGVGTLDHYQARVVTEAEKRADLANRLSDTMEGLNGVRQGQEEVNRKLGEIIFEKPVEGR